MLKKLMEMCRHQLSSELSIFNGVTVHAQGIMQ